MVNFEISETLISQVQFMIVAAKVMQVYVSPRIYIISCCCYFSVRILRIVSKEGEVCSDHSSKCFRDGHYHEKEKEKYLY